MGLPENGFYTVIKRADQTRGRSACVPLVDFSATEIRTTSSGFQSVAIEQASIPKTKPLKEKEVQDAYAAWMPDPPQMLKAMDSLFSVARGFAVQKRAFYDEWNQKATPALAEAMLGSKPTKQTVDELKDLANQLLEKTKRIDPD